MAIYHVHVSSGSRAGGQSAALKVAYILREGPHGGHDDLVEWGSGHMPLWAAVNPRRLFAAADARERKNGRLYVHVWVALPNELDEIEHHDLVLAIGATLTASGPRQEHGLPYVYAVHAGNQKSPCETANPHVHYVISERVNDGIARDEEQWFRRANRRHPAAGGAPKDRTLKEVTWVEDTRKAIERQINEHLAWAGREERVTADSHATRIVEAEAWGDTEAAGYLRRHPPGIHMGPASAAIERNRFRGKAGEEPELARAGEPTERGELVRARMAEEERVRRDLARVSEKLRRARAEERRATESVAAARAVGLPDQEIVGVYEEAESVATGSGWGAVAGAATLQAGRKEEAEAAAGRLGIDVAAVYRDAGGENRVARLKEVIDLFEQARSALMTKAEIEAIREAAELSEAGAGWRAVAAAARTQSAWKERAEGAAREAGITDLGDVYAAAQARGEHSLSALEWATETVWKARSALMTEEEIEVVRDGSGWPALESAAARRLDRKTEAENAAREAGIIDIEREYASAQAQKEDPLARLVAATCVVVRAREALLTDDAIRAVHAAGDSRERGSGWTAVEKAVEAGRTRRTRTEAAAREAGIVDVDVVYAAARSRSEDPLAALEEATAARRRAERREAGLRELQRRPGGREMTIAHLAVLVRAWQEPAEEQVDEALTAAESDAERLARAGRIHGDRWSRLLYVAAAGALGEWFTLQQVDAAMTDAERFAERARGLSQAGRAALEMAVEECGEHAAVDELVAAFERAQEVERQEEERQRAEERRRTRVARQEADVRATKMGPGWLREATERVLQGADRVPTLEERDRIVKMVGGWIRKDLDRRQKDLRYTKDGSLFLDEGRRSAGAVETLAAEERLVETAEERLREFQEAEERKDRARRAERIEALSEAGLELYAAHLMALTRAGDDAGGPSGAVIDRALEATESDARLPRLEVVFRDERSYYRAVFGSVREDVTLEQLDGALEAVETFVRRKRTVFGYPGNSEHPSGGALYAAAVESRAPGPGADLGSAAMFDDALADVESRLAGRVQQAADEFERLLSTTRPYPNVRPDYHVPALSDARFDELDAARGDAFVQATVTEVHERYARRARYDTRDEDRYGPKERLNSEQAYLADVIEMTWDRARRLWSASSMTGSRPTRASALARVLKKYLATVWEFFQVACDKVLGGNLGERLRRRREQVERAADVAERLLETTTSSSRPEIPVPTASDKALAGVVTGKNREAIEDVVEVVWERFHHRSRREVPYEQRYGADDRDRSEKTHLATALEIAQARQKRSWLRSSSSSPHPTLASASSSVLKEHQSYLREIFEVAYDEVFGRGEVAARWRRERDQVRRAVDAAEAALPTTQRAGHPDRHVSTLSDEALDELVAAETNPFLKKMYSLAWERCYRHASVDTPYEHRYDADDRRLSELRYLDEVITQTHDQQRKSWLSLRTGSPAPTLKSARESVLKDYRAQVRGIFTAARDEVLRNDEQQDRRREQSVRPGRAATEPPAQSPPAAPGQEREPHGGRQERGKQQERTRQDSTTGHGSQGERRRAAATSTARPAAVSVTEADRVRLAVDVVAAKLPRTTPYAGNPSHRPPAFSNERFNRLAAATDDEFVKKVIAAVQEKQAYYTDRERAESEEAYLRQAVSRKHQEALDEYEKSEAKRGIFSRRPPEPTWEAAKVAAIQGFETKQLDVIEKACREVRRRPPAAVRRELERIEPGRPASTPRHSRSQTHATKQQNRGDSGLGR